MSERDLVAQYLQARMVRAFEENSIEEAQNLERFLSTVESMSDGQFEAAYDSGDVGAIS